MKNWIVTLITVIVVIILVHCITYLGASQNQKKEHVKVGFIYIGDESTPYTDNFISAQRQMEEEFGDLVTTISLSNISEESAPEYLRQLAEEGCDIIFTTSYGYGEAAKEIAAEYPNIQFCQATCNNANENPEQKNYHTFMGRIYEGRYISGVVAGMKLEELIENGGITRDKALVGYVGAYENAEVISGYTAFLLGIKSVVPEAKMMVKYTNT